MSEVSWGSSAILQRAYLEPVALQRLRGMFVGKFFFPDQAVDNITYTWYYFGQLGLITPEVGENDPGPYTKTRYEQRTGRCRKYAERVRISTLAREPLIIRNRARDEMDELAVHVANRLNSLRINAIKNAGFFTTGAKTYYWKDCDDDNSNWIGGSGNVNIINDIIDANQRIMEFGKGNTDTILCSTAIAAEMKKSTELRDWERSGPLSVNVLRDNQLIPTNVPGSIGRIAGHEVFASNAQVLTDPKNPESALVNLVTDDVYIFERGARLAKMYVFQGMTIRRKELIFEDAVEVQAKFWVEPQVIRPQFIYKVGNAVA